MIPTVACRSCRARIVYLKTAAGKTMPVDAGERPDVWSAAPADTIYDKTIHVSHFGTCPQAKDWSNRTKGVKVDDKR